MNLLNKKTTTSMLAFALFFALLLTVVCPTFAFANSAEPPILTIVVDNAPNDLQLYMQLSVQGNVVKTKFYKTNRAGQQLFKLNRFDIQDDYLSLIHAQWNDQIDGATLLLVDGEKTYSYQLSNGSLTLRYNQLAFINFENVDASKVSQDGNQRFVTYSRSVWRTALLVALRVLLTFAVEGLLLWLFRFKQGRTYIIFALLNLATQIGVNVRVTFYNVLYGYWQLDFFFMEFVVVVAEMLAFAFLVKEKPLFVRLPYVIVANVASAVVGVLLIGNLPI